MLLSQSNSVAKRRKDQKLRNKFKGKTKHKRLDAICEIAYNRSHGGVERVEQGEISNGGNQLEPRRSSRARKAPELLDSSPLPPKKRQKVDRSLPGSVGRKGTGRGKTPFSSASVLDDQNGVWGSRLRSRGRDSSFSGRERGESSVKGKRKLYNDSDDYGDDLDPRSYDKQKGVAGEQSTVVKSKRPGRIKASNILENGNQEFDSGSEAEDDTERSEDEALDVTDEIDGLNSEFNLEGGEKAKADSEDFHVVSQSDEKEETAILSNSDSEEEYQSNGNVELKAEHGRPEKLVCELVSDNVNSADVYCSIDDDQQKDELPHQPLEDDDQQKDEHCHQPLEADYCAMDDDQQQDVHPHQSLEDDDCAMDDDQQKDEHPPRHLGGEDCAVNGDQQKDEPAHRPLEDEGLKKSNEKGNAISFADRKPRIKLGRRCGLCGGGIDGKPPKKLALEGAGSDNEAYTGSSASEEPNYDIWDGFGDQSGWLGRLLGPINDRFGIAGIWVHQQCAVWSPEVYFAGLGCLKNVRAALYRGRVLKCSRCRRPGATIGCRVDRCPKTYHLPCARAKGCLFDHRKFLIVCTDHRHLFQPHGIQNALRLKKLKAKRLKLELRKMANDASRKDIEAEEKWLENCGEDEEFLKRESKRLHRDMGRIAPTYIGGANNEHEAQFQGWESVAGLQDVIRCMKEVVILPLLYPEFFNNLGIMPPRGVLLHGHPGTGKTLIVRALVGSCARGDRRIAYFARKGADCLGKYVGDAERQLRLLFQVAEKSQPSIIFFDEIDGLAPCRSRRQDQTHNSVVSTLLALMDGLKSRGSVIVIGATNRPDAVDPALRRPGRFDREIYFPLPSVKDREAILSLHTQKWPKPLTGSLLKWVGKETVGFAGADLQALCTQAAMIALRRSFPLQETLLAAETRAGKSKTAIHTFAVEERDWLKALSCVPPPCSRRESGGALNDVVSSPLKLHLVPCLLQPLTRLLVCLHLDENVWLPPHLSKASALVKDAIISSLHCQRLQSDKWWLHLDGLLEEGDVMNEIEKNLMHANVLVGESNLSDFDAMDKNADEDFSQIPSSSQSVGARSGLHNKMSRGLCNKSGFHVLICGNPRSGQRHLASCLLHFFVGNVDVWKIDLASISHEGHGDMVHGLTQILMGCTQTNLCMLYLPAIDLWAIETGDIEPEGCEATSNNHQFSVNTSCDVNCEVDREHVVYASADEEATQVQTAMKKASYLWTLFVEQVELMHVNSTLMILATSELPFSLLPSSIRHFFGNELVNSGLSSSRDHKVPQFSLQLDGKFDHDNMINCFAAKLSKDLAQHFVQSLHGENHIHESSLGERTYEMVEDDVDQVCNSEAVHTASLNPVGLTNKTTKVKSSLLLAISSVGLQILSYPHFAELCWVTSKLKEGPYADVTGRWKGWPFNSCIVRPGDSSQKVSSDAFGSGNLKPTKEPGLVRGLVAVGLTAYRGEYTSLREVCSEVRKVLEALVRRINEKVQAGKDKNQFIRILSQVAYLDDMVMSWAHTLQSLEVDNHISEANPNTRNGSFGNHVSTKDSISEGYDKLGDGNLHQSEPLEKDPLEVDANGANGCPDAGDETGAKTNGSSDPINDTNSLEQPVSGDKVVLELGDNVSTKLSNGFTERNSNVEPDVPLSFSFEEVTNQPNGGSDFGKNYGTKSSSPTGSCFVDICSYQCCSECFANLHKLMVRVIKMEWELQSGGCTVEDFNDFLASLSANRHLSLHKLFQGGKETNVPECNECSGHVDAISGWRFIFKDGVLSTLEQGLDVSYHCKFEKLCLDSVIEWLGRSVVIDNI